jgi:hypothetical protein
MGQNETPNGKEGPEFSEFALAARRLRIASGAALSFDIPAI